MNPNFAGINLKHWYFSHYMGKKEHKGRNKFWSLFVVITPVCAATAHEIVISRECAPKTGEDVRFGWERAKQIGTMRNGARCGLMTKMMMMTIAMFIIL